MAPLAEGVSIASMGPEAVYSSLQRKPEPRYRPLVDGEMKLDSGPRRNDGQGLMLRPHILNPGSYTETGR